MLEGGRKTGALTKDFDTDIPVITIVTVVYNAEQEIEETIKSIIGQTYKNIEYIVIDGDSSDNTLDILKKYENKIDYWLSEKDNGIYDAMNKAINLAKGDWINFMNAGDSFVNKTIVSTMFSDGCSGDSEVIYGDNYYIKNDNKVLQKTRDLSFFYKGMPFNHQSCFVKADLMKEKKFSDYRYDIQCEYLFLYQLYLEGKVFKKVVCIVANYLADGFSDNNFIQRSVERFLINERFGVKNEETRLHYVTLISRHLNKSISIENTNRLKNNKLIMPFVIVHRYLKRIILKYKTIK